MAPLLLFFSISFLSFCSAFSEEPNSQQLKTYIVHLRLLAALSSSPLKEVQNLYHSFLPKTVSDQNDVSWMVHSYRTVFTGFAAKLSLEEVKEMGSRKGFLHARPARVYEMHTNHTSRFMGLYPDHGFWASSGYGKGLIIGVLDSGIKANHPSYDDKGMPLPPQKWKGQCHLNGTTCNRKLIGARNLMTGGNAPVLVGDHGTHTSSTTAGNFVKDVDVSGNAKGTAVGIAPQAHLSMYQVCASGPGCLESAVAAGFEAAIQDEVDVMSISLGQRPGTRTIPLYEDVNAIGAFRAMLHGIFVSCSAGNSGSTPATLSNEAPWILTICASTVDRNIRTTIMLGNGESFDGESLYQPHSFPPTSLPLVYPVDHHNGSHSFATCWNLDEFDVRGKIVVCNYEDKAGSTRSRRFPGCRLKFI